MAEAEKDLLLESFLKKRKDTMIFRWSNYWFRLRNTTLSFYTSSEANESCLRGKYYIYLVQSVREVKAMGASHTFEIVMKNGKRKLLSAESADLCKIWIEFLWKSMQLPAPGRNNSSCTWHDVPALEEKANAAVQKRPESRNEPDERLTEPVKGSPADSFHSENESYSEDDESLNSIFDWLNHGFPENQSNSEEVDTAVCSGLQSRSEGEERKVDSDQENKNSDFEKSIYDVPTWQRQEEHRAADTVGKEKEDDESLLFGIYDFPSSKRTANKQVGVTTDQA